MKTGLGVARGCFAMMALTVGAAAGLAQPLGRPDPADPSAAAPMAKPESAFFGYQPFLEQPIKSWKDANQAVADNPGMGSMTGMSGMAGHSMPGMEPKGAAAGHDMGSMQGMPGMGSKRGSAPKAKSGGMAGHAMGSMQGMPEMSSKPGSATKPHSSDGHDHKTGSMQGMPGMAAKADAAPKPHGADDHDHKISSMQGMPGMASSSGTAPKTRHDMRSMPGMPGMPGMASNSNNASSGPVTGSGIVKGVDKANGRIRLTHEPIEAKGWPKMTLFFRLKDSALAERVKAGDNVDFSLEKSASGYVISDLQRRAPSRETKPVK